MKNFFSVVIPIYNKANYIENCLESVLNQTHQDFEIIIVNDGSTDKSLKILERYKNSKIDIISQVNKGVSVARNKGISHAKYDWIALLDADDYWYPHHLEELSNTIQEFQKANVVYNNYEILLGNRFIKKPYFSIEDSSKRQYINDYFKACLVDSIGWTSASSFKKSIFNDVNGFDTDLKSGQDVDLMIKFGLHGTIAFNPKIGARYNKDSENNLAKTDHFIDRIRFISKYKNLEKKNSSLKTYLDINRYSLAIRCKMKKKSIWKKLIKDIDPKSLNLKQRILLHLPLMLLKATKQTQNFLLKNGVYLTAFR